jgi:hypothetical protein
MPGIRAEVLNDTNQLLKNHKSFDEAELWVCTQAISAKSLKIEISGKYVYNAGANLASTAQLASLLGATSVPTGSVTADASGDKDVVYQVDDTSGLVATIYPLASQIKPGFPTGYLYVEQSNITIRP